MTTETPGQMSCSHCQEHSGVIMTTESHTAMLDKFDVYMVKQTDRTFALLIGIILCLCTGLVSVYISQVTNNNLHAMQRGCPDMDEQCVKGKPSYSAYTHRRFHE